MCEAAYQRAYRASVRGLIGERRCHFWMLSEQRVAKQMREDGSTYLQIALTVNRTPDAVAAHLRHYGLR